MDRITAVKGPRGFLDASLCSISLELLHESVIVWMQLSIHLGVKQILLV